MTRTIPITGLVVLFTDGKLHLYVDFGREVLSTATTINWHIDDRLAWQEPWHISPDGKAFFMYNQDIEDTFQGLLDSRVFTIRVHPFGADPLTASFRVRGFREAVGPVIEAWMSAGSRPPGVEARAQGGGCSLLPVAALGATAVVVIPVVLFLL